MKDYGFVHDASELRAMIAKNPDLPIVVLAGEEANVGDYYWMYCSDVRCCIDYILDVETPYDDECVFTEICEFEDKVRNYLYNDATKKLSDDEYDAMVKAEVAKYEPYWKKVIAVYVTN